MVQFLLRWIAPLAVALLPAAFRLWRGRALARRLDDPALPERLLAARRPHSFVLALALAVLAAIWPSQLPWTAPVLLVTSFAAAYPLRKALYGETWSLPTYLWFFLRLFAVVWGFWALLLAAPFLTERDGWFGWAAAVVLIAVMAFVHERHGDLMRFALGARPVDRPDLVAAFAAIGSRAQVGAPRFDRVPLHGGVVANALALPSTRQPGVLFSDTLLERLTPAEVTAIGAHEIAHLEHFNTRRLRQLRAAAMVFVVAGSLLSPLLHASGRSLTAVPVAVYVTALLFYLAVLGLRRQRHETASDLRAIALGGDPEALISALEKLYAFARLPRRWDQQMEQQATHPSLARRVRAIRAAAGRQPLALGETTTFAAAGDAASSVTFHTDRLAWTEADGSSFTMPYALLAELRVDARRSDHARLVAVDARGRRWELALAPADLARVQSVLDIVDAHLRPAVPAPAAAPVARLVAALAALVALFAGQTAGLVALVGFLAPVFPLAAAAGTAALAAGLLAWRDGGPRLTGDNALWPILVLPLCGAFLLSVAWRSRDAAVPRTAWRLLALPAIWAVLSALPLVAASAGLVSFHVAARTWSGVSIALLAMAAGAVAKPGLWSRLGSAVAAAAGVGVMAAGSAAFVDAAVDDPMLLPSPPAREITIASEPEREFTITISPTEIGLSPGGRSILVIEDIDEDERRTYLGRVPASGSVRDGDRGHAVSVAAAKLPEAALAAIDAADARFVSDDDLLMAIEEGEATIVRRIGIDAPRHPRWEQRVSGATRPRLALNAAGTEWRVILHEPDGGVRSVEGSLADGAVLRTSQWDADTVAEATPVAAVGDRLLLAEDRYRPGLFGTSLWSLGPMFNTYLSETSLWVARGDRRTRLAASAFALTCADRVYGDGALCTLFDGSRTHVVAIDLPAATVRAVAWMPGHLYTTVFGHGWVNGLLDRSVVSLHLDTRTLVRVPAAPKSFGHMAAAMDGYLAAVSSDPDQVRVRVFAVRP